MSWDEALLNSLEMSTSCFFHQLWVLEEPSERAPALACFWEHYHTLVAAVVSSCNLCCSSYHSSYPTFSLIRYVTRTWKALSFVWHYLLHSLSHIAGTESTDALGIYSKCVYCAKLWGGRPHALVFSGQTALCSLLAAFIRSPAGTWR